MDVNELLKRYAAGERDFKGINLIGSSLSGINLSRANLREASLSEADLTWIIHER